MKKIFICITLTIMMLRVNAQNDVNCLYFDKAGRAREHTVDFIAMSLDLSFNTQERRIFAKVAYSFTPLRKSIDSLVLDAPDIQVDKVLTVDQELKFRSTNNDLIIYFDSSLRWGETYSLEISYTAQPEKGLYFLGWDDKSNRARKQIWTQGQGVDNRYWIPSYDDVNDKLYTETFIRFETGYEVISNGDLIEKKDLANGTTLWHYKMQEPHVVYLIMLAIGDYAYADYTSKNGVVSRQFYYPDQPQDLLPTYQYTNEMMDWMEAEFGIAYPWGKMYRNVPVVDFLYGAMENTSSTIYTDVYLQDSRESLERNYIGTNAHELTHQWFGDLITEWSGTHHWLHESFATHYAKHFKRAVLGDDLFQWDRYQEMQSALNADDKNQIPIASSKAGSAKHYPKGSIVIDMLRTVVGEEEYKKVIHSYLSKYSFKHVDTHLFYLEFLEVLGLNLDWFFDQWIYKGGYPHYEVSYTELKDKVKLNVAQIQEETSTVSLFRMPVDIELHYLDGSMQMHQIQVDSAYQEFALPKEASKKLSYLVFDSGNKIYKRISFIRNADELLAQASSSKEMIDRYLALKELEEIDLEKKRSALINVYTKEEFFLIKANIIKQVIEDDNKASKKLIKSAFQDVDAGVRRALIDYVDKVPEDLLESYEYLLQDSSYLTIDKCLNKLASQYPEKLEHFLSLTEADSKKNTSLRITYLKWKYTLEPKVLDELIDYSSQSFEFRTRMKAMEALEEIHVRSTSFIKNLLNASLSFNSRLASNARNILEDICLTNEKKQEVFSLIKNLSLDKNEQKRLEILEKKIK
ncbi:MAG: M1 family metallopeptidase [Chitinophagales bacterium]